MEISTTKKALLSFAALIIGCGMSVQAQTMTGTVLVQPCNNNGQIGVTVAGLTPPISYTYSNWIVNQNVVHSNISGLTDNLSGISAYQTQWTNANTWQVVASDGVNSVSQNFVLTPAFTDSIKVFPAMCPALSTVQATNFVGGTAPFTCVWTNQTSNISYTANPAAVPNGLYGLVITDAAGCKVTSATTGSSSINVWGFSSVSANINGTAANCTNGTATITASGGTGPYTYLWSNNAVTSGLTGLSQGYLTCVVTDAVGCQTSVGYQVTQAITINFNTTITNATCVQTNGAITSFVSGGTAPYTFQWSNNATTQNVSGLAGGQLYNVQITDAVGCTRLGSAYVSVSTPIAVTFTASPSSCTSATGSATLTASNGASPYSVIWYSFPTNSTGTSISNKASGTYQFKVTDANGCIKTGSAFIPPASSIVASLNSAIVICPATTGNLAVTVSGTNGPFTYLWSNNATTSSLNNVAIGGYNCVITDAVGCSVNKYATISQNNPINVGFNTTSATCIYNANGSATANATGGTSPYTYVWSNTQMGATASNLMSGNYFVNVTDANGCHNTYNNSMVFVGYNASNNSCYCTITGTVYADANNNCARNTGENGIPNIQIHCSGLGYKFTDGNGVYSFMAPTGTYTLSESIQQIHPLASCQNNNQVLSVTAGTNCSSTMNFANNTVLLHDLRIYAINSNQPIPGNSYSQMLVVENDGSIIESAAKLGYKHDGQLTYSSCTPWALTQQNSTTYPNWYSITSGFPTLNPNGNSTSMITYNVPTNIPLNTVVSFNDSIASAAPIATSWLTDNTPWNNVNSHNATVIGSYDPNFKEVTPQGTGVQGNISIKDSVLTYVIHFQNTGSYYAQNIYLIDTLDANLNLSSMRPGYSDHNYSTSVNENRVIRFDFKNINLPWKSSYGDVLSSGMVSYSIRLKSNLAMGAKIKNKAAIYFDYNEPVITNTTLNTIAATPVSVNELKSAQAAGHALLFPNPANNYFTLELTSTEETAGMLNVYDVSGREVSVKSIELHIGENSLTETTGSLQNGIYFVQLKADNLLIQKKLVIAK